MKSTKDPAGSPEAFRRFLAWLDQGNDSRGETYLEIRRRLVSYFARKRCLAPDDLADETLTRAARRLNEEGTIADAPARYCYIVARFVFLEHLRRQDQRHVSLEDPGRPNAEPPAPLHRPTDGARERALDCLERCLDRLDAADRGLILDYYRGERQVKIQRRRELAVRLGVTPGALSIRGCRIRNKLEACVQGCLAGRVAFARDLSHRE